MQFCLLVNAQTDCRQNSINVVNNESNIEVCFVFGSLRLATDHRLVRRDHQEGLSSASNVQRRQTVANN